jgi:hypothetical protein
MEAILEGLSPSACRVRRAGVMLGIFVCLVGCVVREDDLDTEPLPRSAAVGNSRRSAPGEAVASVPGSMTGNHLSKETSPYLLAHARDPVDWHPWGSAALERARAEGKLIFVSVGFGSCHWCHQMASQVFSDPAIARYMNEHFINIKIDREERPDLDELFMSTLTLYYQAIGSSESGGWPLSLFLTPDAKPLGGGTYFSPKDDAGNPGFPTIMQQVVQSWDANRSQMQTNAEILSRAVVSTSQPKARLQSTNLDRRLVDRILKRIQASHDPVFGGFGFDSAHPDRAKFPHAPRLALLQFAVEKNRDEASARMLELSLDRMAAGGIYDHLAGGFHRYSTDRNWRVPHFEKLLADNALLIDVYTSAWEQTQKPEYREVAERTADFLLRDLTDSSGIFYAAIDADSEDAEGKFYLWTQDQVDAVIPPADRPLFFAAYRATTVPGFPSVSGKVLEQFRTVQAAAAERHMSDRKLAIRLKEIRSDLLNARQQRKTPARDDQVVAAWNGLAIHALAHAGAVLSRPDFTQAAEKAATNLLLRLRDDQRQLLHCEQRGQPHGTAFLDDYAFVVHGLLALQQATGDLKWQNAARNLTDQQIERFWDEQQQGCFFTPSGHEHWLTRSRHAYDTALPAGNSVTARNLLRLAMLTGEASYRERARQLLEAFSPQAAESPDGTATLALALAEYFSVQQAPEDHAKPDTAGNAAKPAGKSEVALADDALPGDESSPQIAAQPSAPRRDGTRPAAKKSAAKKSEKVTGVVYLPVDRLPAGQSCRFAVRLKIAEPWHINANPAGPKYLIPTVLKLKSKVGTTLKTVRYPKGVEDKAGAIDEPGKEVESPLIYSGEALLSGIIEIPVDAGGQQEELLFEVKYQACQGENCLPPKTLLLKVPVSVAPEGEPVKATNTTLFPPARRK